MNQRVYSVSGSEGDLYLMKHTFIDLVDGELITSGAFHDNFCYIESNLLGNEALYDSKQKILKINETSQQGLMEELIMNAIDKKGLKIILKEIGGMK